jgi:hypothetical protein
MRTRLLTAFVATVLIAPATAPAAQATVAIGQTGADSAIVCSADDEAQPPVSTGQPYTVPSTGGVANWILTSWSHEAGPGSGQQAKVKVWRQVSGLTYTVVGQDGPRNLASGVLNTFTASIPVKTGDILGITPISGAVRCAFGPPGEQYYFGAGDTATGGQATFIASSGRRLNISATLEPTNTFTIGQIRRNKKNGTATVTVDVPNPGDLTASGNGVKAAGAAVTSKAVAAGTTSLTIRAKGKKRHKLNDKGKVTLNTTIAFTPTGGAPSTLQTKVKLKKKKL